MVVGLKTTYMYVDLQLPMQSVPITTNVVSLTIRCISLHCSALGPIPTQKFTRIKI
jgi:hypothetical protein